MGTPGPLEGKERRVDVGGELGVRQNIQPSNQDSKRKDAIAEYLNSRSRGGGGGEGGEGRETE